MRKCSKCGYDNADDATYCGLCMDVFAKISNEPVSAVSSPLSVRDKIPVKLEKSERKGNTLYLDFQLVSNKPKNEVIKSAAQYFTSIGYDVSAIANGLSGKRGKKYASLYSFKMGKLYTEINFQLIGDKYSLSYIINVTGQTILPAEEKFWHVEAENLDNFITQGKINAALISEQKKEQKKSVLNLIIGGIIVIILGAVGQNFWFLFNVIKDISTYKEVAYAHQDTGFSISRPDGWGWVLITDRNEFVKDYNMSLPAAVEPMVMLRNKRFDAHLGTIMFPKSILPQTDIPSKEILNTFFEGQNDSSQTENFTPLGDSEQTVDGQVMVRKDFSYKDKKTQSDGKGFVGVIERKDSFIILFGIGRASSYQVISEGFNFALEKIKLSAEQNIY